MNTMKLILNIVLISIPFILAVLTIIISNSKRYKNKLSKNFVNLFVILNCILFLAGIGNTILQQRQAAEDAKQIEAHWQLGELTPNSTNITYPGISVGGTIQSHSGLSLTPFINWSDGDPIYLWIDNGQVKMSLTLRDSSGAIIGLLDADHISFLKDTKYDLNYDSNGLEIVDNNGAIILQVNIRDGVATLYGILYDKDGGAAVFGTDSWQFNPPGTKPTLSLESIKPIFKHPGYLYFRERITQ